MRSGPTSAHRPERHAPRREHRVGRHHVHPHVVGGQLQTGDAGQLVSRRLGGAVGAEIGARGEDVLGRDQDDVAAGALPLEMPRRLGQHQQRPLDVHLLELAVLLQSSDRSAEPPWATPALGITRSIAAPGPHDPAKAAATDAGSVTSSGSPMIMSRELGAQVADQGLQRARRADRWPPPDSPPPAAPGRCPVPMAPAAPVTRATCRPQGSEPAPAPAWRAGGCGIPWRTTRPRAVPGSGESDSGD